MSLTSLSQVPVAVVAQTAEHSEALAARVGESVREFTSYLGALSKLSWQFCKAVVKPPVGMRAIIDQCDGPMKVIAFLADRWNRARIGGTAS